MSPSEDVKYSNVRGLYLRKYGTYNFVYPFQASIHLKNHSDEVEQKIVSVLDAMISQQLSTWQPSNQLPSKIFKDLCRQLSKVHESVADVWSRETTTKIMTKVCDF